jgi:hypothetical protein
MSVITKSDRLHELMCEFLDPDRDEKAPKDEREWRLNELACQMANLGKQGIQLMLSGMHAVNDFRLRAFLIAFGGAAAKVTPALAESICKAARPLLNYKSPLIVAEAADLLTRYRRKEVRDQIVPLLQHSSPYVVGAALRYMARLFPKKAVPLLEDALASSDPIILQNAIDELDDMGYAPALPKIKRLLKYRNKDVRQAARTAVKNLESGLGEC